MTTEDPEHKTETGPALHKMLLGQFDLLEELGSGGSGTVYRARITRPIGDLRAGTEVAVKFLRQDRAQDPRAAARLAREGQLGRRIRSPYVAAIHAVETIEVLGLTTTYLVMELVEGRDLRAFLTETGDAVEDLVRRIGHDAARGLAALHRLGIVHRDVKPENLALTPDGQVKLMDLGLARETAGGPRGGFSGSLAYAAPEVLRGQPATPRSDLYSLGLVLFELATGHHPFAEHLGDDDIILHAHLEALPPRPSHLRPRISALLETLILELLAKDPKVRPTSAREVATALERGERSRYWLERERRAPVLASRRRLQRMRRFAPTAFVDRRDERRTLDRCLRQARGRHGTAVRVCGPHGIGRRRLLDECVDRWIRDHDDVVFFGAEPDPQPARQLGTPFLQIIADWFLRGDDPSSPHAAERLVARIVAGSTLEPPEAERLAALISGGDPGPSAALRADLLVRALRETMRDGRTLILRIDRADELDSTARLVVERLLDDIGGRRCLLLLVGGVQWINAPFGHRRLALRGLDAQSFDSYATALFAPGEAPRTLLEQAHRTLAGNPGNLLESLEDLGELGAISGPPGRFRVIEAPREIAPPQPLLGRLSARVAELDAAARHVLQAAAILGPTFPIDDLAALTGHNELYILESLSIFQGHVLRVDHNVGRFRHREYRRALLVTIPTAARQRLHRSAAWVLEDRGAAPLEVGLHLSRAREHEACLEPLLAGLERLVRAGSRRASRRVAERLHVHLNALPRTPLQLLRRLRWLLLAGQSHVLAERSDRASREFRKAYRLALYLGDDAARAQALLGLATVARARAQWLSALQLVERAQNLVATAETPAELTLAAHIRGHHARVLGDLGDIDGALAAIAAALERVRPDDTLTRPHLLIDRARLEALRGRLSSAVEQLDLAAPLARTEQDPIAHLRLDLCRGWIATMIGDLNLARQHLEAARAAAHALADPRREARAHLWLGDVAAASEDLAGARDHHAKARALAQRNGDRLTAARAGLRQNRVDLETEVRDLDVAAVSADWHLAQAQRCAERGDPDAATAHRDAAGDLERRATLPLPLRLRVLAATGRTEQARQLIAEAARGFPAGAKRRIVAYLGRAL